MTKEKSSLLELYEQSFKDLREGEIVTGKIVKVFPKEILVDVGYKSEGIISKGEFPPSLNLAIGEKIQVLVESKEDEDGMIHLSFQKAKIVDGWNKIKDNYKEGALIEGRIKGKVKGGFIAEVFGNDAFLPNSLSMLRGKLDKEFMNKSFKFQIVKLNLDKHSLVLSRKAALQKEKEETESLLWDKLKVGEVRSGMVKNIADFGAFIDLGGIDGLLHITDMSWSRISHPSEMLAVGNRIEVVVLKFDRQTRRVSLGLKQRMPDPWEDIENKYPLGSKVKGKVVNILNYGIFVELEKGVEGLVHISELSWQRRTVQPQEMFAIGDMVETQVLNIEKEARRISLSIKQLELNPWLEAKEKYPIGSKVTGRITGFTDYGAFITLDANLEGMIHISDMSWTSRIKRPQDILKKGQKIEAMVLTVDSDNRRISLGLRQLTPNPWPKIIEDYPVESILEGEVTNINNFGVFVKIGEDLEGLVYPKEIDKELLDKLKPEEKLKVKVIKVDTEAMKIGLSAKI